MKKLKILFCGFRHGHINGLYKKVAESDIAEIVGCVEENAEARAAAEKNLGATFSDRSYEEWLEIGDFDTVAIGNAYGERGKKVIAALRAGKHIIADKPLCTSAEELVEIRELSEKKNLKIACMLDLRYIPQTLRAKEILHSGRLGEIKNIGFTGQHALNYGTRPSWYFEEGMHGGTVNDLSIHGVDLVRMFTRSEFSAVDGARLWNSYAKEEKQFKDSAMLMARLESGAEVLADVSYSAPSQVFSMPTYWDFKIWGEKGLLTFNYINNSVTVYEEGTPEPLVFEGVESDNDYLTELVREIEEDTRCVTENVLRSTDAALFLQREADRRS